MKIMTLTCPCIHRAAIAAYAGATHQIVSCWVSIRKVILSINALGKTFNGHHIDISTAILPTMIFFSFWELCTS